MARALASSPRELQRCYAQFGEISFSEDLLARRMSAAADLLAEQPAIAVADVARLVGYRQASHFARMFRGRYGLAPARFRELARRPRQTADADGSDSEGSGSMASAPGRRTRISARPHGAASGPTVPPC